MATPTSTANLLPEFPVDVLQHIQKFMSYKEATRSSILCSDLYESWYARKNIELDESLFRHPAEFWNVGMNTMRRYEAAKQKIEKFTIRIVSPDDRFHCISAVIEGAAKQGAVEIKIIIIDDTIPFQIPSGVFRFDKLVRLDVVGGALYVGEEIPVICSSLKFMSLLPETYLFEEGNYILNNYILKCPNLEQLVCRGFLLRFDCSKMGLLSHNLDSLELDSLDSVDYFWIAAFIPFFHQLRSLKIRNLNDCRDLAIYSPSLLRLSIEDRSDYVNANLIVPSLQKLEFEGVVSSTFKFNCCVCGLVSSIKVAYDSNVDGWFYLLHKFLQGFSSSKIFLSVMSLDNDIIHSIDADEEIEGVPVELLVVANVAPLVDSLKLVCLPTVIQYNYA